MVFPLMIRSIALGIAVLVGFIVSVADAETTPGISAKAEAAAMEFARTNHPELASLLEQLKTNAPSEYRSAMIELDKTRERLEKSREKTPERADLELAEWKVNSRIRLLSARMAMGAEPSLESDLKAALRERVELRVQLLNDERARLRRRLEKLDETIAEQERRAQDQIDKEFAGLKRGATAAGNSTKKNNKAAESKPNETKPKAKTSSEKKPEKASADKSAGDKPATSKPSRKP